MKQWKLLDSEDLVDAPWLKVAKEKCELPNGKVIDDFYTLWQPDWVMILARTKDNRWAMTKQYRHGTQAIMLEFPAGIINKGETPEKAAIRELQEECGFCPPGFIPGSVDADEYRCRNEVRHDNFNAEGDRIHNDICVDPIAATTSCSRMTETEKTSITYLGSFSVNPDRHRGRFHVVFIDGVVRLGNTHFDDTEDIETLTLTDEELQAKIANGTFNHPLQIAGYFKWKLTQK